MLVNPGLWRWGNKDGEFKKHNGFTAISTGLQETTQQNYRPVTDA